MLGNIGETFELLFDKNNNVAYKALQELQKESEETDCVYPFIDRLSDMLDSDNSYIRTRGLTLLAYNEKWDKEYKVEKNLARYALFVMFFPQLVAGPIERSRNLLSQFYEKHEFEYERVKSGLLYMLWGLFQKIVIADRAAIIVNQVYNNSDGLPSYGKFQAAIFFKIHKRILAQMAYFFKHMAKGLHLHSAWREQMLKRKEI